MLISGLSASFLDGIQSNEAIPKDLSSQAQVELVGGIPFIPDDQLEGALSEAGITGATASAIVDENEASRIAGLRESLAVLALLALVALFFTRSIPTRQPGKETDAADTDELGADGRRAPPAPG